MNDISSLITSLSARDKKEFTLYLKKKNKRKDVKNLKLFKLLDSSKHIEDPDVLLYGKSARGAYHALSKRLYDALIDFVATKKFDEDSSKEMTTLKLLLASKVFFQHQQHDLAFRTLAKAEQTALSYSLYNSLNEIYLLQLTNGHLNDSMNFQEVHKKYQENKLNIIQEENLNLFYAAVQDELTGKNPQISDIIERNLERYNISLTKILSYQSLFRILQISNEVANITRNYHEILEFVEEARERIVLSETPQHEHLYEHIQILYYLSNTYFRIKQFKRSDASLKRMHELMLLQDQKFYDVFYCQYTLIKNLILIYTGQVDLVIQNLSGFDYKRYKDQQVWILDLKLTFIVALFLAERFHDALKIYREFHHSDKWYAGKTGFIWVIKKNLMEILVLMELDYMDLVESRLKSFRSKHKDHLMDHNEKRVLDYVSLISAYYNKRESVMSEAFSKKLDAIVKNNQQEEDIFAVSFYAWLKAKIESGKTYDTCLDFVTMRE